MKLFTFNYSSLDITVKSVVQSEKVISNKECLSAQVQMLLFLNKCNKEGNGKVQYWCEDLRPTKILDVM